MNAQLLQEAIDLSIEALRNLVSEGGCIVVCYNQAEVWKSRTEAAAFYLEAMCACEGAERERYTDVLLDLMAGKAVAHDRVTRFLTQETVYR